MFLVGFVFVIVSILVYVRFFTFNHWNRHGIPSLVPSLPFGNLADTMLRKLSFGVNLFELYFKTTEPLIGLYLLWRPAILLRDPALVKRVLVADFAHFHDRGIYTRPEADPMSDSIFAMTGHRWKALRSKLTPMFTAGRLKIMLPTVFDKADHLVDILAPKAEAGETIEIKDFTSRFGLDSIASIFFGLDVDTITNREHHFRLVEKESQNKRYLSNLGPILIFLCPGILKFFRMPSLPPLVRKYIVNLVKTQIEHRENENVVRKDFIQCLIQIRNSGKINADESDWNVKAVSQTQQTLSIEQCAAQVFIFYLAGFDTSASTVAFTIFEVARNPRVKALLQSDIDRVLEKHNGVLSYEAINEMSYLELCVIETLRKYPALPILNRICTKDYAVPNSSKIIKEGSAIIISLLALGRDPLNFPNPMEYRPERYTDQPPNFNEDANIPFGDGPRMCIGLRIGKLMAKVGIIKLLQKYNFSPINDKELVFDNFGLTLHVEGGIPLKITNR